MRSNPKYIVALLVIALFFTFSCNKDFINKTIDVPVVLDSSIVLKISKNPALDKIRQSMDRSNVRNTFQKALAHYKDSTKAKNYTMMIYHETYENNSKVIKETYKISNNELNTYLLASILKQKSTGKQVIKAVNSSGRDCPSGSYWEPIYNGCALWPAEINSNCTTGDAYSVICEAYYNCPETVVGFYRNRTIAINSLPELQMHLAFDVTCSEYNDFWDYWFFQGNMYRCSDDNIIIPPPPSTGGSEGSGGYGTGPDGSPINLQLLDTTGLGKYPTFKNLVLYLPSFLERYPNIVGALANFTGFSREKIMQLMRPGIGPKINITNLPDVNGSTLFGEYTKLTKTIAINAALVRGLDAVNSPKRLEALTLLMAVTTLHEFVHYGRDVNNLPTRLTFNSGYGYEAGYTFELSIQPEGTSEQGMTRNNAIEWVRFYEYNVGNN